MHLLITCDLLQRENKMTDTTKGRVKHFGTILAAAILGAAMWEGISHLVKPAYARDYPDPRNVTAMRMEQLKATVEINENITALRQYIEEGKLEVKAELKRTTKKTRKKSSSKTRRTKPKSELEIKRD